MVVECFIFMVFPVAKGAYLIVVLFGLTYCIIVLPVCLFLKFCVVPATIREHLKNRQQNRILL